MDKVLEKLIEDNIIGEINNLNELSGLGRHGGLQIPATKYSNSSGYPLG